MKTSAQIRKEQQDLVGKIICSLSAGFIGSALSMTQLPSVLSNASEAKLLSVFALGFIAISTFTYKAIK